MSIRSTAKKIELLLKKRSNQKTLTLLLAGAAIVVWPNMFDFLQYNNKPAIGEEMTGKIGLSLFVAGFVNWIMSYTSDDLQLAIKKAVTDIVDKISQISSDKNLAEYQKELVARGIYKIFTNRRTKDDGLTFEEEIAEALNNTIGEDVDNREVKLMGICLSDFFLLNQNAPMQNALFRCLTHDVKFKVLLLDPLCGAADRLAKFGEKRIYKAANFSNTALYRNMLQVARNIANVNLDWIAERELIRRIRENITVRYYPFEPSYFLTITPKLTFVDQYHYGGDAQLRQELAEQKIIFVAGYSKLMPSVIYKNEYLPAKVMSSHFDNIWNYGEVIDRGLVENNYIEKIEENSHKFEAEVREERRAGERRNKSDRRVGDNTSLAEKLFSIYGERRTPQSDRRAGDRRI